MASRSPLAILAIRTSSEVSSIGRSERAPGCDSRRATRFKRKSRNFSRLVRRVGRKSGFSGGPGPGGGPHTEKTRKRARHERDPEKWKPVFRKDHGPPKCPQNHTVLRAEKIV